MNNMSEIIINRIRKWLLFQLILYISLNLQAADFKVNGVAYKITSIQDRTCIVTSPNEDYIVANLYSGHVVIPQNPEYKGRTLTVVGIDNYAFYKCENLYSVTIPPTVVYIGESSFLECKNLSHIYGDINASIGTAAFAGCKSLCDINLKQCDFISNQAFLRCSTLSVISIPGMVSKIGEEAFAKCGRLSKVEFKDGQSDLSLYMDVFKDSPIENMYIGRNLSYFSNSKYRQPFDQIVHLIIGNNVTSLNKGISLYDVTDYGAEQLMNELSEAYKSVLDLSDLKTVVFGRSLSRVPAFEEAKLESITCCAQTPPKIDGKFSYYVMLNSVLYVPKGSKEAYKSVAPWKDFWTIKE